MLYNKVMTRDLPRNIPLWGYAYSVNDTEKSMGLKKPPVLGEIVEIPRKYSYDLCFVEYKKNGGLKMSSKVYAQSRRYASTYEEAVREYNDLVQRQIAKLERLIDNHNLDLIEEV